jgi:protein-tyrosine phosphatase
MPMALPGRRNHGPHMPDDLPDLMNFRDVGHLLRCSGFPFRTGLLLRSGLTRWPADERIDEILGSGRSLVIDLRSPNERRRVEPLSAVNRRDDIVHFVSDIEEEAPHLFFPGAVISDSTIHAYYVGRYAEFATGAQHERLFGRVLQLIMEAEGPVLVHCTAGKDRTGTFIALLLYAMGVPESLIETDYMASAGAAGLEQSVYDAMARLSSDLPPEDQAKMAAKLSQPHLDYLRSALAAVHAKHGSLDEYFNHLDFPETARARLRARFLDAD